MHLRRLDYKYAHKENVPSIQYAAEQIKDALKKNKLDVVYISTDAPDEGILIGCLSFLIEFVLGSVNSSQ